MTRSMSNCTIPEANSQDRSAQERCLFDFEVVSFNGPAVQVSEVFSSLFGRYFDTVDFCFHDKNK